LRIIENVHPYLKPGGLLIIEDIFKLSNEQEYLKRLKFVSHNFQDYYFVTLDHKNRNSIGWDNDKLFVLIKAGGNPIFKNKKNMTIITPSTHPANLFKIRDSIDFNYVDEWIIVYDGSEISQNPNIFINEGNPKIKEYIFAGQRINGNSQRNYALDHIQNQDTFLYFLDEDTLIHKDLFRLMNIIDDDKFYTFDQQNGKKGSAITMHHINNNMFLIDFNLCKTIRWALNEDEAVFYYINECYSTNSDKWVYVNNDLSF
jgi:hypothetical protein